MTIAIGDTFPAATLKEKTAEGVSEVDFSAFLKGRKVVLFAVPGAFTPTCSMNHLPGFVQNVAAIKAKGIDTVACVAVNDVFVMDAWGKASGANGNIMMLADGNGDFARALGLEFDLTQAGLGKR